MGFWPPNLQISFGLSICDKQIIYLWLQKLIVANKTLILGCSEYEAELKLVLVISPEIYLYKLIHRVNGLGHNLKL